MKTEILDSLSGSYKSAVNTAAEILKNGGTVAIPTETVYGLAADCFNEHAIKSIFTAKGRPQDNPLIVHISDMEMLPRIAREIPQKAYECAKRFWPGPFTMILKRNKNVPACVSAGLDTVAVRMPSDKTAHDIIKAADLPLAAPSANLSGKPSPTKAEHVIKDLSGKINAIVAGGDCTVGVESTVITLVGEHPRLLRPGAVTREELIEVLPDIIVDKAVLSEPEKGEKVASPGMKYKHYSPETETYLVTGDSIKYADFVNGKKNAAAICFAEEYQNINIHKIVYGSGSDAATLAKNLFAVLREADGIGAEKLYVHAPDKSGVGLAVYNRLIRAAAFKVIEL